MFVKASDFERHCEKTSSAASRTIQGIYRTGANGGAQDWLPLLKALLDQRPCPCFLLTPDLIVSLMNEAAQEQHGKFGISVSANGMLRFADAQAGRRLAAAIRRFNEDDEGSPALLSYEGPNGSPAAIVVRPVLSLAAGNCEISGPQSSWFLLSVRSSLTSLKVTATRIAATFHLTPAEASLAAALAEGLSLHEYAGREDVKITTVRWHLQNIFERTGARNQQELMSMIVSLFG